MIRKSTIALIAASAVSALAAAGSAWLVFGADRSANTMRFANSGTDLQASDVQAALSELASRVKTVESGQAALQGAAAAQEARLATVQSSSGAQEAQIAAQATRVSSLETRVAETVPLRQRLEYSEGAGTHRVGPGYARLRTLGSFTKQRPDSAVLLVWNTHVDAVGEPGTFCDFQLRVDGRPDTDHEGGGGRAVVYVPSGAGAASSPVSVSTLFGQVGAGSHTVGVWVRGSARECQENFGNFPRAVLVEEAPRG